MTNNQTSGENTLPTFPYGGILTGGLVLKTMQLETTGGEKEKCGLGMGGLGPAMDTEPSKIYVVRIL